MSECRSIQLYWKRVLWRRERERETVINMNSKLNWLVYLKRRNACRFGLHENTAVNVARRMAKQAMPFYGRSQSTWVCVCLWSSFGFCCCKCITIIALPTPNYIKPNRNDRKILSPIDRSPLNTRHSLLMRKRKLVTRVLYQNGFLYM